MSTRITPAQFNTLQFINQGGGSTLLLPVYWRDRHHQALLRHKLLRLRTDPFKTNASMLKGWITAKGREAVRSATGSLQDKAKALSDRDYERYMAEIEAGRAEP